MLRPFIMATALTGLIASQAPAPAPASYDQTVRRAGEALSRGDPVSALALLDQALRLNPEGPDGFVLLGRIYRKLGRQAEAAAALKRAAALLGESTPAGQDALCEMAAALASQERNVEAIEALRKVLAAAPRRIGVHHDIGEIELALGRLESAASEFREEIALHEGRPSDPALVSAREMLGIAAYRMGDDETALASLLPGPGTVEGRFHLGLTLARQGRDEEAAAALRDVLRREPDHRGALQSLARVAGMLGLKEERSAALQRFQALYLKQEEGNALRISVRDLRARAEALRAAGDTAEAVDALEEATRLSPDDIDLLMDLGRLRQLAGDRARAEDAFRAVLRRDPLRADAQFRLARILTDKGDLAGATAAFEEAARIEPMATAYHVALAQLYLRMARTDDGVRELRLARRINPDDPESYFNLGVGLAQAGALADAASELEEAVRRGYRDPLVHQMLAQVYRRLGDLERSEKERLIYEGLAGVRP
ncbi:MAG TPA: tetratricopeptide repeat protein [Candidatus Polarisedimenticolia bacterium]